MRYALIPAMLVLSSASAHAQGLGGLDQMTGGVGQSAVGMLIMLTLLSLAPAMVITVTCFPFIVTVLSILRQSIGLQQSPPNMLIVSLSMMLTWFVMQPVISDVWTLAGEPLRDGAITLDEAVAKGVPPIRSFIELRTDPATLATLSEIAPGQARNTDHLSVLVPAFLISEIQRAFEVGFLIALPFLIIDLVVSAILMSMGMMMLPPAVVSLPFKLAFFSAVSGWELVANALIGSYQ